ncbi:uncharacterized protein LOC103941989 [Pyrus x bretschneideri]|uniref:uncharacterized protein LOC103941989 n=1 Tax=Pyrus x bretschneideri TaxID=225117 RepID=UPI00202EFBE7|nr:uncharacterized protein LOC103941989 [Pyrus x bretschneideri]
MVLTIIRDGLKIDCKRNIMKDKEQNPAGLAQLIIVGQQGDRAEPAKESSTLPVFVNSEPKVRGSLLLFTDGLFSRRSLSQKKRLMKRFRVCLYEELGVVEQPLMQ